MAGKIKKVLLNALVLPGLGQLVAKQYAKGTAFALIALGSIVILLQQINSVMQEVMLKLQSSSQIPDMDSIMATTQQILDAQDIQLATTATYAFIICWVLAILDALFIKTPSVSANGSESTEAAKAD